MKTAPLLLVEDHPLFRSGLRIMLEKDSRIHVCAEAGTCAQARQLFDQHRPSIILLDVRLPDGCGLDLLAEFRQAAPQAIILMLTSEFFVHDIRRARDLGASGYLLKATAGENILTTIQQAARGQRTFPRLPDDLPTGRLTPRETEVIELMARGVFNKDIARILGTSIHTINTQVRAVLCKLEAADRAEAVGRAYQLGILKPGL